MRAKILAAWRSRMALCVALCAALCGSAAAAEVVLVTAARVHTMDLAHPHAQAFAYDDAGRILRVGDAQALQREFPGARRLDLGDATVVPGLIDAHGHVADLGLAQLRADLVGTRSKAEVLERLREFAQRNPGEGWLLGNGWDQNDWPDKRFPAAADLDAAFPDRPVWLSRIDGHAAWANSAAMRAVKRDLSGEWQPDGGRIERRGGEPTGVFIDSAQRLVEEAMPGLDAAARREALVLGMREAVRHGLTGVHDAGVSLESLNAYRELADAGELPMRITAMADGDGAAFAALCRDGVYAHPSGRLRMRAVKLYADGALGSRGAALLADYSDDPGNRGLMLTSPADLLRLARRAKDCGVQAATHAIGDGGNHAVLEAYAAALGEDAGGDHRWRIEHAQVLAPEDLTRLARLQVIASMQPTHATSDMPWAQDRLGPGRVVGSYAWRRLRDSGARLALGSDFPVESVDPRLGLYAAVTRADARGQPPGGWRPQEKLTAYEALRGFSLDAAHAGFADQEVGSLEPGKRADFVVLGQDPLAVAPEQLPSLTVLATYVDGRPVYEAGPAPRARRGEP